MVALLLAGCGTDVPGAMGAPVEAPSGSEPAPPPPAPPAAAELGTPATFAGTTPAWIRARRGLPWAAVAVANPRGLVVHWWNRETGERTEASRRAIWGPDTACDLAADGRLACVKGGDLVWVPPPGDEGPVPAATAVGAARAVYASPGGRWLALVGDDVRVVGDGAVAWTGPGAAAAGWFGDSLVLARDGAVTEVDPAHGAVRELGALPAAGAEAVWTVTPDGTWAVREGDRLVLHPPTALGTDGVASPVIALPPDVQGIDWIGPDRFVVRTGAGIHLYRDGRPVPLQGDLAEADAELLRAFAP